MVGDDEKATVTQITVVTTEVCRILSERTIRGSLKTTPGAV